MLLLGRLGRVQGLKGEFLLNPTTGEPDRIPTLDGLLLAPQDMDLSECAPDDLGATVSAARQTTVRSFRWHQDRPCLAFDGIPDRTAAEPFRGWGLWAPEGASVLQEGETYRHDWVGCHVFVGGALVGEVLGMEPTQAGYDMVRITDLRPGRHGVRNVPYIKAWFGLDLPGRRIDLDPPDGLLDVDGVG
jgi:16S rRNA processing protein RimM